MRPFRVLFFLLALVALASACGGDGGGQGDALSLEQYYQRVDELVNGVAEQGDELIEEAFTDVDAASSDDAQLAASRFYLEGFLEIIDQFLDDLRDTEPPSEVRDAHDAFVDAAEDFVDASRGVVDGLEDVLSPGGLGELLDNPDLNEAGDRIEEACFEVQDVAEAHGIVTDLNCSLQ
jgi:hypothetical protein